MARAPAKKKAGGDNSLQLAMFAPSTSWTPPDLATLPDIRRARRIAADVESRDPQLKQLGCGAYRDGYPVGFAIAIEDGPAFYLPIRHLGGNNLPEDAVLRYMREMAKGFTGEIVGANLQYDWAHMDREGIEWNREARWLDVQVADPLLYELHMSYSLKNIAERLGLPGKDEALLEEAARAFGVSPKAGMWKLPARFVGPYAEQDVRLPLQIMRRLETRIDEHDLWDIWRLECQVLPVLARLRKRGIKVDQDRLAQVETWSLTQEAEALAFVKAETGVHIDVGDVHRAEPFAAALQAIGVNVNKTAAGKDSVDKFLLSSIKHPVAEKLLYARKVNKLRTTFASSVRRFQINGRIHPTFNQIAIETEGGDQKGARYGRLSCVEPNMQQQPSRDEFAKMWRSIYVPEPGAIFGSLDYSQQEPRWTTHFAAAAKLEGAAAAAQAYWDDPKIDNHQFMADLTGLPRKYAKNLYLGLCYGEGGAKLCKDLGLPTRFMAEYRQMRVREFFPTRQEAINYLKDKLQGRGWVGEVAGEEGQNIINTFDDRAPFIRKLAQLAERKAKERGWIRTIGGRVLHFPLREDGVTYDWAHKGLNRLIQGSSADQVKRAMVMIDQQMPEVFLQLQVHDEMDGSFESPAQAEAVAEIMRTCMGDTLVPFRVDVELGPSWGEAV